MLVARHKRTYHVNIARPEVINQKVQECSDPSKEMIDDLSDFAKCASVRCFWLIFHGSPIGMLNNTDNPKGKKKWGDFWGLKLEVSNSITVSINCKSYIFVGALTQQCLDERNRQTIPALVDALNTRP